jgi:cardiolipin synthase
MGKIKSMIHKGFEIISDIPADTQMLAASKYIKLINNSKKEILIETPYFVPPIRIRKALARAVKRGVKVIILLPYKSDVGFIDIVRNRYLGSLYKKGINIHYYTPKILHSKLLLVDKKFFILGSSNLDYRSFIHHYEINLFGRDKKIIQALYRFYKSGLERSKTFDYREWRNRTSFKKILEILSSLINTYL